MTKLCRFAINIGHQKKGIEKLFKVAKKLGKASTKFKDLIRTTESMSLIEKTFHGLKVFKTIIPMIPYAMYSDDKGVTKGLNKYFFKDINEENSY